MNSSLQTIDDYTNKYQLPFCGRDGDCQKDDFEETTYCETTASHLTNISHYEIKQAGIGYDSAFHFTQACLNSSCQTRDITGPSKFAWLCIYWQQLHFLMALK